MLSKLADLIINNVRASLYYFEDKLGPEVILVYCNETDLDSKLLKRCLPHYLQGLKSQREVMFQADYIAVMPLALTNGSVPCL